MHVHKVFPIYLTFYNNKPSKASHKILRDVMDDLIFRIVNGINLHCKRRGYSPRTKTLGKVKKSSGKDISTFYAALGSTSKNLSRKRHSRCMNNTESRMPLSMSCFSMTSMASRIPLLMSFLATKPLASEIPLSTSFLPTHIVASGMISSDVFHILLQTFRCIKNSFLYVFFSKYVIFNLFFLKYFAQ